MALVDEVKAIVNGDEVVDNIIDLTVERLEKTWNITGIQAFELAYSVSSIIETIKNAANQLVVPEGLTYAAVDMICGEFLQKKLDAGNLPEFNVKQAIKTLKIGDTSTTFQDSGKSGIELLLASLSSRKGDLLSHRKLKW